MTVPTTAEIKAINASVRHPSRSAAIANSADKVQNIVQTISAMSDNAAVLIDDVYNTFIDFGVPSDTKYPNSKIGDEAIELSVDSTQSTSAPYMADRWIKTAAGWVNLTGASRKVADPGNAGAIGVDASGTVQLVTGGAETRTLAAPSFLGQTLCLNLKTDGGDCVVTCATAVNQTGNNKLTLADAGDEITLKAVYNGANLRWRVVSNDGVALATV